MVGVTITARMIWLCGQQYTRCASEFGGLLCADREGHDGKHHSNWQFWTTTEQTRSPNPDYDGDGWDQPADEPIADDDDQEIAAHEFAALDAMIRAEHPRIGDTRACPDCGRPQHYTGAELGWCHDATFDTLACGASPALLAELEK